jgi:SAM-dependent methyltransferase
MPHLPNWLLFILIAVFGSMAYAGISAAPWYPTFRRNRRRVLDMAGIKPGDKVYDLGCGSGWFVMGAALLGAKAAGFELSIPAYLLSKIHSWFTRGPGSARILFGNFWQADLSDADLIYVFLTPRVLPKLRAKLEKECRPGTRILCHAFPMPEWTPVRTEKLTRGIQAHLYLLP